MSDLDCVREGSCGFAGSALFDLLGRKYALDLVGILANHDTIRFGEIDAHLPGASSSTIAGRLDDLEAEGLVRRERYEELPPRVEYELTAWGRDLAEHVEPLAAWIAETAEADRP